MSVFRNFNQEELDQQYNVRAGIPGYQDIFLAWEKSSAEFRRTHPVRENLAYGPDIKQTLDFFPAATQGRPLLVFIHGGYWQSLDKSDFSYVAAPYLKEDINVAVVNYRLAPDVRHGGHRARQSRRCGMALSQRLGTCVRSGPGFLSPDTPPAAISPPR